MSKPYGKPDRIVVALGGNALGDMVVSDGDYYSYGDEGRL